MKKTYNSYPTEVRLILENGEQYGLTSYNNAKYLAKEKNLDLLCITDKSTPHVYKICDKGKFLYEKSKKDKKNKQKQRQSIIETKEMQFKLLTQQHDLEVKAKKIQNFININKKVKLVVKLLGRQIQHADKGVDLLDKVKCMVTETEWEQKPTVSHNRIIAILTNGKRN